MRGWSKVRSGRMGRGGRRGNRGGGARGKLLERGILGG